MRRRGYDVWTTVLEQGYAIDEEVEKHLWADVIFLQTPVYWFGTPWIYKKYVDEVFTVGMLPGSFLESDGRSRSDPARQYGTGGRLQGKQYMLSLTWDAPPAALAYTQNDLLAGQPVDEVWNAHKPKK